jgi:hypothetical protein
MVTDEICKQAQVVAITGALDYILSAEVGLWLAWLFDMAQYNKYDSYK